MEIAAISGHKSLTMLKRYTHLRATQLVSKLDIRKRQAQKLAAIFVPYPAELESSNNGIVLRFPDLEHPSLEAQTKEDVIQKASFELLRIQALAARSGERLPPPGNIKANDPTRVLINPL